MNNSRSRIYKRVLIISILFIFGLVHGFAQTQSDSGLGFGFCDAPENDVEIDIFNSLGAEYVRMGVNWNRLETAPGIWDFTRYDNMIRTASESGRKVILMLCYEGPEFHGYEDGTRIMPAQVPEFLRYVQAVIDQWGSLIAGLEVWNEPNLNMFWEGSEEEFFYLTTETVKHIKNIAPEIPVAVGSILYNPWIGGRAYLRRFLDSGAMAHADALSLHPYGYWVPNQAKWISQARNELDGRGYEDRQIWITEVGYPTRSLYPHRVLENELPRWTAESLIRLSAAGADIITWYHLYTSMAEEKDAGAFDVASFALLYREPDGRYISKKGLDTWGRVATALGGKSRAQDTVITEKPFDTTFEVFAFEDDKRNRVLCLWSNTGAVHELMLTGVHEPVVVIDSISGERSIRRSGEAIKVGEHPLILSYAARTDFGNTIFSMNGNRKELRLEAE